LHATSILCFNAIVNKVDIVEVVERYVPLRRAGRELAGLCPFHSEKTASFFVNADKQVFLCRGCGVGGDVIMFIEKIENLSFKEACKLLSLDTYRPQPRPHRAAAEQIATWSHETSLKLRDVLRDLGSEIYRCARARRERYTDSAFLARYHGSLTRRFAILCDVDDDVNDPHAVVELHRERETIEHLIELAI
jgi:DNA primase